MIRRELTLEVYKLRACTGQGVGPSTQEECRSTGARGLADRGLADRGQGPGTQWPKIEASASKPGLMQWAQTRRPSEIKGVEVEALTEETTLF